jgi:hypothetical protein
MSAFSATRRALIFVVRFYTTVVGLAIPGAVAGALLLPATVILSGASTPPHRSSVKEKPRSVSPGAPAGCLSDCAAAQEVRSGS